MRWPRIVFFLILFLILGAMLHYTLPQRDIVRITGTEIGLDADHTESMAPSISADGRYVAFQSNLENLDFYDTNSAVDVFIYDRADGSIRRVSSNGAEGGEDFRESTNPSISGDGRYVAFESQASNLVVSDTNGSTDIFLKDLQSGEIVLISSSETGTQGDADSFLPSVSFDGRCVAFQSNATNLKSNDTNDSSDVFVAFTEKQDPSAVADLASLASNLGAVRTGEVAVLARTNAQLTGFADALKGAGIAVRIGRCVVGQERWIVAVAVAAWRFDLDDSRAQVGEKTGPEGPGKCPCAVDDSQIFERAATFGRLHAGSSGADSGSPVGDLAVRGSRSR